MPPLEHSQSTPMVNDQEAEETDEQEQESLNHNNSKLGKKRKRIMRTITTSLV